jgi:O-antigen/teichoic acid export membrane protein
MSRSATAGPGVAADGDPREAPTAGPAGTAVPADAEGRGDLSTLARGGMLNLVGAAATGVLSFILVVVLTRGLGRSGYGAFVSAMGLFTILSRTSELGADTGLVRTVARYRALHRTQDIRRTLIAAFVPVLLVSTAFAVALWVWAPELARMFGKGRGSDRIADFARVMAPFLPASSAVMVALSGTRGFGTMVPSVLIDKVARPALQPLLAAGVFALGFGTVGVALAGVAYLFTLRRFRHELDLPVLLAELRRKGRRKAGAAAAG